MGTIVKLTLVLIILICLLIFSLLILLQHFNKIKLNCLVNLDYYISNNKILMGFYIFCTVVIITMIFGTSLTLYMLSIL
ncbi:hypothetical protein EUCAG14_07710 [Eubacterium callanderi]|nr:hypothetical protein EUCAG14_07710 [Eubacterium callanderi]